MTWSTWTATKWHEEDAYNFIVVAFAGYETREEAESSCEGWENYEILHMGSISPDLDCFDIEDQLVDMKKRELNRKDPRPGE